ncbi:MAG: CHAT domain-containing protein [Muribaculaceae bacterium]|nr:CHAT domain-containing protein [Muribaculaceae bacterium]
MNRLILLICIAVTCLAAYAHFPSPLAQQANVDSLMIYGDKETYDSNIKSFKELAANANNKEDAAIYGALTAEFHCFAGQPEESLRIYSQLIDSFSDEISDYTQVSILCSAIQTAIDLGIIDDMLPYLDTMTETFIKISDSYDDNGNLSEFYALTLIMIWQFSFNRDAVNSSDQLAIRFKEKYGEESPQYAIALKISGYIKALFDMRSQAASDYSEALDIWADKKPTVDKFSLFIGLGALACEMSDFNSAKQYINNAEKILLALGLERTYYGMILSEMKCTFFTDAHAWDDILHECEKAERLSEDLFGPNHVSALRLIASKATALGHTENPVPAMELLNLALSNQRFIASRMGNDYLVALSVWSAIFGPFIHDDVITVIQNAEKIIYNLCPRKHVIAFNFYEAWGAVLLNKSDFKGAADKYRKSFESSRNSLHTSLSFLTEADRAQLIKDIYQYQDNVFGLAKAPSGNKDVAELMFDNAMFIKSLMMQSVASLKHQVEMLPETETEARLLLDSFLSLKRKRLHGEEVSEKEFNIAEQKLLKYLEDHPEHGDYLEFIYTDWKDLSDRLGDNDVVVEFIVSDETWDHNRTFAAEVLSKGEKPRHVKLLTINNKDKHLLNTDKGEFNKLVCDSIWTAELRAYLPKGGNVYFVPTAELYGMALEFIPVGEERTPMFDMYNMVRLSSSRELMLNFSDRPLSSDCTAAIFGGLNYNTSVDDMELYALEARERGHRGSTLWQSLPGTRMEAENVAEALHAHNPVLITGDEGIEESFKALDGSGTNVIHIATHGFYNTDETSDPESALDRTGLIMSGANNYWLTQQAPLGIDDGVLTAREIADLDLRGTDMVVLSACQTGLGDVSGEGVFGLQRAFKMAGAQTILMSLWPVNDEATQIFMTEFYRNLMTGQTKRQAMSSARQLLAKHTFTVDGIELPGSHPQFSAAFVLLD